MKISADKCFHGYIILQIFTISIFCKFRNVTKLYYFFYYWSEIGQMNIHNKWKLNTLPHERNLTLKIEIMTKDTRNTFINLSLYMCNIQELLSKIYCRKYCNSCTRCPNMPCNRIRKWYFGWSVVFDENKISEG